VDGGQCITADRGGIAAGRDVHVACTLDICPRCETRLIRRGQNICRCCARAARLARIQRDGTLALIGYGVCVAIGLQCLELAGYVHHWFLAAMIGVLVFGAGYCAYLRVMVWAQRDARRQWHGLIRVVTVWLRRVVMFKPIRRVPDSERENEMERDEADAAKVLAEATKLIAEAGRINAQARWFPVMVAGGVFAVALIVAKFVL
jgi:hypothetical protein